MGDRRYEDHADYTFVLGSPPPDPPPGPRAERVLSELERNLVRLTENPGQEALLATYKNKPTCSTVVHALRTRRTAPKRPDGIWTFRRGITEDGRHGVWGIYNLPQ